MLSFGIAWLTTSLQRQRSPEARVDAAIRADYRPRLRSDSISALDASCIPAMLKYLRVAEDGAIFNRVAMRLYELHARGSIPVIIQAFSRCIGAHFMSAPVGAEAIRAWGNEALPALLRSAQSPNAAIRRGCADLLGGFTYDRPVPAGVTQAVVRMARSNDVELRKISCSELQNLGYGTAAGAYGFTDHAHHLRECAAVAALTHLAYDEDEDVRHRAMRALVSLVDVRDSELSRSAYLGDDNGMSQREKVVETQFTNPLPQIRAAAVALVSTWDWNYTAMLNDPDPTVVDVTAFAISNGRIFIGARQIAAFAKSRQTETRRMVAWLLGRDFSTQQLSVLKTLSHDRSAAVRRAATDSLARIRRGPLRP